MFRGCRVVITIQLSLYCPTAMWTSGIFLLSFTLLGQRVQGQTFGTLREPRVYLEAVVDALWVKIKEHGISNFPVLDTTFSYNYTGFGIELVGPISFEDGFVQDIDLVSLNPLNFQHGAPLDRAFLTGRIMFENLRLYTDLRADLASGLKIGSVVFTPTSFIYELSVTKLHGNDTIVPRVSFFSYTGLVWDSNPHDIETELIRRQILNQTNLWSPMNDRPDIIRPTGMEWIPLFTEFVEEIIGSMDFPTVEF